MAWNRFSEDSLHSMIASFVDKRRVARVPDSNDASEPPVVKVGVNSRCFRMSHSNRGLFLIFNHKKFLNDPSAERFGTDVDRDELIVMALALGFHKENIRCFNDLTRKQIDLEIEKARRADHTDSDCIVVCVLTHGFEDGNLLAYDGEYSSANLFVPFEGTNCMSLVGKPKIFFIQACYGDKHVGASNVKMLEHDGDSDEEGNMKVYNIPNTVDFLIHRSTVPGYYSYRNEVHGSWFMQTLIEVLIQSTLSNEPEDLLSLLTVVNQKVAYEFESRSIDPNIRGKKQAPSLYHTLTRKIFFSSKTTKDASSALQ